LFSRLLYHAVFQFYDSFFNSFLTLLLLCGRRVDRCFVQIYLYQFYLSMHVTENLFAIRNVAVVRN
ncbi:hypothetical protein T05_15150, partial [Trichinella murrelli]